MEIARACGIHHSKLSFIVHGWRKASDSERVRIAECLGVPQDGLFPSKVA